MKRERMERDIEATAGVRMLVRAALLDVGIIGRFLPGYEDRVIDVIKIDKVVEYEELDIEELAERVYGNEVRLSNIEETLKTISEQILKLTQAVTKKK